MYQCINCNKEFINQRSYNSHIKNNICQQNNDIYTCDKCEKEFRLKRYYDNHISKCTYKKKELIQYTCELCNEQVNSKAKLKAHQTQHVNNGECKCNKCNKEFKIFFAFMNHIKTCNGVVQKQYVCKHCGEIFEQGYRLATHVSVKHSKSKGLQNFECPFCNKKMYCNKGAYKMHVNMHDEKLREEWSQKSKRSINKFYASNCERSIQVRQESSLRMKLNNPSKKPEIVEKMKISHRKYWDNLSDERYSELVSNYINAPKRGNAAKHDRKYNMTSIEKIICDFNIDDLEYNGNKKGCKTIRFKHRIDRRSFTPDFIYKDGLGYVEVFGVYWHPKEDEQKYYNEFKENDIKFIIVWEDKLLNNPLKEKRRILKFLYKCNNV